MQVKQRLLSYDAHDNVGNAVRITLSEFKTHHVRSRDEGGKVVLDVALRVETGFLGAVVVTKEKPGRVGLVKADIVETGARLGHWHRVSVDPVCDHVSEGFKRSR